MLIASGTPPSELERFWKSLRKRDVIGWNWRALAGSVGGIYTFAPLRRLFDKILPVRRFEELKRPLIIVTTHLQSGHAHYHERHGDLVEPLIASMSLPGLFPPVWIDGGQHVDGSVADDIPLDLARRRGADELLMISCTCCDFDTSPLSSPLKILQRSFMIALDSKYDYTFRHRASKALRIRLVRPHVQQAMGLLDFGYVGELIEAGYKAALSAYAPWHQAAEMDRMSPSRCQPPSSSVSSAKGGMPP